MQRTCAIENEENYWDHCYEKIHQQIKYSDHLTNNTDIQR